jgi:hypothetical protein
LAAPAPDVDPAVELETAEPLVADPLAVLCDELPHAVTSPAQSSATRARKRRRAIEQS